ncbi:PKR1 [Candida metapsilosis]|uniref:PKR1 n=1 Tax=Candida metapsilosis TaxID=273372 RepID=A0A8H7ZJ01_9ASCO|nr:PKR1 [Candida metapsilosis]
MVFIVELWESIFTPGTTPALIKATHGSFILLIVSLATLIFLTKSIHFVNLLVIAVLLYGTVIWFINELQQVKLKNNEELNAKNAEGEEKNEKESDTDEKVGVNTGSIQEIKNDQESTGVRKRKA